VRTALATPVLEVKPHSPVRLRQLLGNAALLTAVLIAWALLARFDVGGRPLIAGPSATLAAMDKGLGADLLATFGRAAVGLALGSAAGLVLGLLVTALARVAPVAEALLDLARSVPPVVLLPTFLLALGYDDRARVTTIAVGCAVIIATSVNTALRAPRSPRAELLSLSGATWWQTLLWTQPWEAMPTLVAGVRISTGMAIVVATVTEMVAGAEHGVGARIVSAHVAGQTPQVTAAIVSVGVVGWVLNFVIWRVERGTEASPLSPTLSPSGERESR
jgi:ABC-type nitrate/sulfonate/bicarbonate transport system permease component